MVDITKRSVKGSPLTNDEVDDNFDNLNTGKVGAEDIGTDPNQVPLNQYLGSMAYQDLDAVSITGGTVVVDSVDVNGTVTADGASLDGAVVINESGADVDFRVESDTNAQALFVQGSDGNIGIGTSSPSNYFAGATNLVISGSGDSGLTINSGTSSRSRIHFADGTSGNDRFSGYLVYNHTDNSMQFGADGSEAMRIDSDGNVGIGTTTPQYNLDVAGNLPEVGLTSGSATWRFRVSGSDFFLRQGTPTTGNRFVVKNGGNVGIGTDTPAAKLEVNGSIIANGVYLGGTVAANRLDDYETGTWTPVIVGGTTSGTGTYTAQEGIYTKVGDLVTVACWLDWSAHTGTGAFQVGGLPFSSSAAVNLQTGSTYASNFDAGTSATQLIVYTSGGNSAQFRGFVNNGTRTTVNMNTSGRVGFTISYREA